MNVHIEPPRRYDPQHILWYFGAITAAIAGTATVLSVSSSHRGIWQLLVGIVVAAVFGAAAWFLLGAGWRVPGGVLVATAVAMVPAVSQAFERLIGVWPSLLDEGLGVFQDFQGAYFALGVATILAGLAAYASVRFPFVFLTVTIAALFTGQLLVPAFVNGASLDDRASGMIVTGCALLLVGLVLDSVARRGEAFWWHVVGLFALAVGLTWYAFIRNSSWAWIAILIVAAVLILASAPFNRSTWASFGVVGVFGAMLHYDREWTGSWRSPVLMVLVSLGLILLGIVLQLNAQLWASRLGRQPAAPPLPPPATAAAGSGAACRRASAGRAHRAGRAGRRATGRRATGRRAAAARDVGHGEAGAGRLGAAARRLFPQEAAQCSRRPVLATRAAVFSCIAGLSPRPRRCAGRGSPRRGTARRAARRRGTRSRPRSGCRR